MLKSDIVCRSYDNVYRGLFFSWTECTLDFYRATLCVSAVFSVARCLSVSLSVTLVYCIQMAEDIVKLLCQPSSPIILVS